MKATKLFCILLTAVFLFTACSSSKQQENSNYEKFIYRMADGKIAKVSVSYDETDIEHYIEIDFSKYSEAVAASYAAKPTVAYILASVTYGAVIEEVMLRLFAMSLAALLINRLILKRKDEPTDKVFIAANIVSALLFALGHLPTTFILLGNSPLLIIRCLILNGGFGLLFGYLYRKYGLRYAMIAHGGVHIVAKLIWLIFI